MPPKRLRRLAAVLFDGVIGAAELFLVRPTFPDAVRILGGVLAIGTLAVQWYLLSVDGQTIGKRLLHMRIVRRSDGEIGGFWRNVVLRSLIGQGLLAAFAPYFVVDSLMIFTNENRCAHDYIAGTRVVDLSDETTAAAPPA